MEKLNFGENFMKKLVLLFTLFLSNNLTCMTLKQEEIPVLAENLMDAKLSTNDLVNYDLDSLLRLQEYILTHPVIISSMNNSDFRKSIFKKYGFQTYGFDWINKTNLDELKNYHFNQIYRDKCVTSALSESMCFLGNADFFYRDELADLDKNIIRRPNPKHWRDGLYKEDEKHKVYVFRIEKESDIVNVSNSENSFDFDTNLYEEYNGGKIFHHTDYMCLFGNSKIRFIDLHSKFEYTFDASVYEENDELIGGSTRILSRINNRKILMLELKFEEVFVENKYKKWWNSEKGEEDDSDEDEDDENITEQRIKRLAFDIESIIEIDQMIKQKLFAQKITCILSGRRDLKKRLYPD